MISLDLDRQSDRDKKILNTIPFSQRKDKTSWVGRNFFRKEIEYKSIIEFDVESILKSRMNFTL